MKNFFRRFLLAEGCNTKGLSSLSNIEKSFFAEGCNTKGLSSLSNIGKTSDSVELISGAESHACMGKFNSGNLHRMILLFVGYRFLEAL